MANAILIELSKLVRNFDEIYDKVYRQGAIINVVKNGKVLTLIKEEEKGKRNTVKSK